jgi:hypothetical protein
MWPSSAGHVPVQYYESIQPALWWGEVTIDLPHGELRNREFHFRGPHPPIFVSFLLIAHSPPLPLNRGSRFVALMCLPYE